MLAPSEIDAAFAIFARSAMLYFVGLATLHSSLSPRTIVVICGCFIALPAIYQCVNLDAGGLMSYGTS